MGAQGVSVKPGVFAVGRTGSRDIQATGKWGPRYVTWAELTHLASGRTFFHFNANMNEQGPQHFMANGFALARVSWVDAIFYSVDHWRVVSDGVGDPAHSDHAPVIAELQMK